MDQLLPDVSRLWVMFHDSAAALCLGDLRPSSRSLCDCLLALTLSRCSSPVVGALRGFSPLSPWLYYVQFDCVVIT